MRLRGFVKAPQRLENESIDEPSPQQTRHRSKAQEAFRYIDYNPNLTPAVFPTFDQPRVPEKVNGQVPGQDKAIQPGGQLIPNQNNKARDDPGKKNKVAGVDLSDIPSDLLESYVASNGDLNPIYVRNMDIMAQSPSFFAYCDMEDSDTNDAMVDSPGRRAPTEAIPIPNPEWSDLTPSVQVEILDNLLQPYNWSTVSHMLGLSTEEGEMVQEYMTLRQKQVDLEDSQLQKMRDKQVKSLLKIDNSAHHRTPHRLVFRRTSRQFGRRLSGAIDIDFFSCHLGEFENAKRFLEKRGIDTSYAGEWTNGMPKRKTAGDDTRTSELNKDMVSGPGSPSANISAPTSDCVMGAMSDGSPGLATYVKQPNSSFSPTGMSYPGRPKDLFMRQGDHNLVSEQSRVSHHDELRASHRSGSFHLNIGTQQTTLLRNSECSCIEPLKLVKLLPPIIHFLSEPPPSKTGITKRNSDTPIRRQMPIMTSSMRLRQKLEQVRLEAQRERLEGKFEKEKFEYSSDDDWSSAFSLPKGRPRSLDSCSQPTSPGRILREREPEQIHTDDIFALVSTIDAPMASSGLENLTSTACSSDQVRATPGNGSEYSVRPSISPSSIGFSDNFQSMTSFIESTPDGGCSDSDLDYVEEYGQEEDEMVLVPTSSASRHTRSAGPIDKK